MGSIPPGIGLFFCFLPIFNYYIKRLCQFTYDPRDRAIPALTEIPVVARPLLSPVGSMQVHRSPTHGGFGISIAQEHDIFAQVLISGPGFYECLDERSGTKFMIFRVNLQFGYPLCSILRSTGQIGALGLVTVACFGRHPASPAVA
jgi:hypothetical protein